MKRIDQILNDCVFDKKIKKDTATVSVSIAEAAMRRFAEQQIKELEKKVLLYENTREMPSYIRDQEQQIKELKEEVTELTNRYIKEVENGSRSREKLADLRLSMVPTETIIRGFANLFDGYVKNQHAEQQIDELKKHVSHDIDCRVHDETGGICNCEVNGCDDY